jgi:hypothetical protein
MRSMMLHVLVLRSLERSTSSRLISKQIQPIAVVVVVVVVVVIVVVVIIVIIVVVVIVVVRAVNLFEPLSRV